MQSSRFEECSQISREDLMKHKNNYREHCFMRHPLRLCSLSVNAGLLSFSAAANHLRLLMLRITDSATITRARRRFTRTTTLNCNIICHVRRRHMRAVQYRRAPAEPLSSRCLFFVVAHQRTSFRLLQLTQTTASTNQSIH
jgi:hypothetical protein